MSSDEIQVVENWQFAVDFPELPKNLIERPHLLSTMADALTDDAPVLFLEGDEGDGATTTLAQFCRAFPAQAFALFVKPASSVTYGLEYLRLTLAEQFHWYYYGESLRKDLLSVSEFEDLRLKTLRKDRTRILYFVIDGLHQIPAEGRGVVAQIFRDLLPTGAPRCRFLVTGAQAELASQIHNSVKSKHYRLLKFSLDECKQFLSDLDVSPEDCGRIYQLCNSGSPGRIAVVRRLISAGTSLSSILETDPAKYLEFVKLEFSILDEFNQKELLVVAGIAHSKISQAVSGLADTFGLSSEEIRSTVRRCQFLRERPNTTVEYISETHRKYAMKQLEVFGRPALEAQLAYLQRHPKSETSLRFLPVYLETLQQQEAILQLLSNEYYSDLLQSTESFLALKAQAEMGARSALALERASEVFKFSLQRTIFASASQGGGSSTRVKALVALGKSNAAIALANSEVTKEGRLALLSTIARRFRERDGTLDPEILSYIRRLVDEVDLGSMGDAAMDIAADVLMFDADLAIGIIETAIKGTVAKDAAYAGLSFSASMAKVARNAEIEDKARPRISDQALQQIAHSFELIAGRLDAEETMQLVAKMPPAHQVHFICALVNIKSEDSRVLDLVELGLDVIIREAEYTPRARDLAALCAPFAVAVSDIERLRKLVTRFDSQLGLVGKATQSRDLILLQMRLAAAERQYDVNAARDRVLQTYYEVGATKTPEAQMECLAIMLGNLARLDRDDFLEAKDGFRTVIKADLDELLALVLKDTADHISTVMPVLKSLAADDCEAAIDLAGRLNTRSTRDLAHRTIAAVLVMQPYTEKRFDSLTAALMRIADPDIRSQATKQLLSAVDANPVKGEWVTKLESFREHLMRGFQLSGWDAWMFRAASEAGRICCADLFEEQVSEAIDRVESPLEEADVYFRASEALAESKPILAQKYYDSGLQAIGTIPLSTSRTTKLYGYCMSLVSRSLTPLAKANLIDDDKLKRHAVLIDNMPGIISRVRLLNEFAERLWCAKRSDLTNRIVNQQIRPLLEEATAAHASVSRAAVRIAFPSLAASHIGLAVPILKELSDGDADQALFDAAVLRLRHLSTREPMSEGRFAYHHVEAADISDAIALIEYARSDSAIFSIIQILAEAINDRHSRTKFTSTQKADWSAKLRTVVDERLPDLENIKHLGYKVVCLAYVYSMVEKGWPEWQALERDADAVDNRADRGYIYTHLASVLPSKYAAKHRKRLLDKALNEINQIPSPIDRLSHLEGFAKSAHRNDAVASARECLKAAMKVSIEIGDHAQIADHRRALIDFADQVDPGLADELIQLVDDDPARGQLKEEARHVASIARAKREMANAKSLQDAGSCDLSVLPIAAWRNLGALEAGRLEVKPVDVMTQYVTMAASVDLEQAYPVLSWHIANLERKYTHPRDVASHLVPLCEAMLLSAELTCAILRGSVQGPDIREEAAREGMLVRRRTRDEALVYIGDWIQANADKKIVYCDAYFSTKDIQLLRICLSRAPRSQIKILASRPHLIKNHERDAGPFMQAWRQQSDQDPPDAEVVALGYRDVPGKHVLHDRWLLTGTVGLRLGTSFNALGVERLSEISEMEKSSVLALQNQIEKYLSRQRVVDGAGILYDSFTL